MLSASVKTPPPPWNAVLTPGPTTASGEAPLTTACRWTTDGDPAKDSPAPLSGLRGRRSHCGTHLAITHEHAFPLRLDDGGRLVLPVEVRQRLKLRRADRLLLTIVDELIAARRSEARRETSSRDGRREPLSRRFAKEDPSRWREGERPGHPPQPLWSGRAGRRGFAPPSAEHRATRQSRRPAPGWRRLRRAPQLPTPGASGRPNEAAPGWRAGEREPSADARLRTRTSASHPEVGPTAGDRAMSKRPLGIRCVSEALRPEP